jgi:hypothetical protein
MSDFAIKQVVRALTISLIVSFAGLNALPAYAKGGGSSNNHPRITTTSSTVKTKTYRPTAKADKLKLDNKKIDDEKNAAQQKYNDQMDTANVKMIRGVIKGGTGAVSNSDRQQIEATKLQTAVDKADQQSKTANDGNQAAKDSVKKTLDQLNEINRATNCLTSC